MGNKLFGIDIAKEVFKGIKEAGGLRPLTLRKFSIGTATVGSLTAGTNDTPQEFSGEGFVNDMTLLEQRSLVKGATGMVSVLGGSLPDGVRPEADDEVDLDGTTYTLLKVGTDPAAALFECQAAS